MRKEEDGLNQASSIKYFKIILVRLPRFIFYFSPHFPLISKVKISCY